MSEHQNAFEVLMNARQQLSLKKLPDLTEQPKTAKQRLTNTVISFLGERKCEWHGSDEVSSVGRNFVTALTDALWTIDGHHPVFSDQSVSIPSVFVKFVGYNRPEVSKHRLLTCLEVFCALYRHIFFIVYKQAIGTDVPGSH